MSHAASGLAGLRVTSILVCSALGSILVVDRHGIGRLRDFQAQFVDTKYGSLL